MDPHARRAGRAAGKRDPLPRREGHVSPRGAQSRARLVQRVQQQIHASPRDSSSSSTRGAFAPSSTSRRRRGIPKEGRSISRSNGIRTISSRGSRCATRIAGYSETDIWKMLGGGVVAAGGGRTSWDAPRHRPESRRQLPRAGAQLPDGRDHDRARGRPRNGTTLAGTGDYRDTKIAIGKYLSQGLYVKYKQGLSIIVGAQIEVEYRISNLFLIRSEVYGIPKRPSRATARGARTRSTSISSSGGSSRGEKGLQ